MQSLPLHARKTPTKGGQETDYSTAISTALFRGLRSECRKITWATAEFTQISRKRHFDMKLWGWNVLSLYIFHTLKQWLLPIDRTAATSHREANRTKLDLFPIPSTSLEKH
jgi:hypothetical protein